MHNAEICIDCERSHANQRRLFPVGMTVRIFDTTVAKVVGHCCDGRAVLRFLDGEVHTFHQLDQMVRREECLIHFVESTEKWELMRLSA